jgi:hypothetical protein
MNKALSAPAECCPTVSLDSGNGRTRERRTLRHTGCRVRIALVIGVLAVLAAGALLTPIASADTYRMKRDGLGIFFRTQGQRVAELRIYYTMRCEDGRLARAATRLKKLNRPIDRNTGRFTYQFGNNTDTAVFTEKMIGFVSKKRIKGRFASKDFDQQGPCWTGRSLDDPWIRFVAKRVTPPEGGKG